MTEASNNSLIGRYREVACGRMLRHAATLPFYREHWREHLRDASGTCLRLEDLPTTSKADIPAIVDRIMVPETIGIALVSSGSSRNPMIRGFSARDLASLVALQEDESDGGLGGILIDLEECAHGFRRQGTRGTICLGAPLLSPAHLDRSWRLIAHWHRHYAERVPIRGVLGAPWTLATFAAYLRHLGVEPRSLGLHHVYSFADRLPTYARQEFEAWFGAPVTDVYSLSELKGHAPRCDACGHFHFTHQVVPEFLALDGPTPVEEGLARMVVTDLGPDLADTPLIRYDTGDLVVRVRSACEHGLESFEMVGRRDQSPRHPRTGAVLIPDRLIGDALALSGCAAREPVPLWWGSPFEEAILEPLYAHAMDGDTLRITVQRAPHATGDHADIDRVFDALLSLWPPLRDAVRDGIDLRVAFEDEIPNPGRPKWRANRR